ncbi:MAG TPA: hypothetical protein VEM40_06685 [Nitrospirota bacterium]|nr:hypothetical protein [Nitrospirota bacterium]
MRFRELKTVELSEMIGKVLGPVILIHQMAILVQRNMLPPKKHRSLVRTSQGIANST